MTLRDPLREEIRRLREAGDPGPIADALISLLSAADVAKDQGRLAVPVDTIERTIIRNILRGSG
jgi:hypothetical protein